MQLFKFTNTLLRQLNQSPNGMLPARYSNKVFNSVIILNAIQMVDNPSLWQFLFMILFPNQTMFKYAFSVPTIPYFNIAITSFLPSAFPTWMFRTSYCQYFPFLSPTSKASFCFVTSGLYPTGNAIMGMITIINLFTTKCRASRAISTITYGFKLSLTKFTLLYHQEQYIIM